MKQLENFFELDGKLLYAKQSLTAFDPVISPPVESINKEENEKYAERTVVLDGIELRVEFRSEIHYGPLRGKFNTRIFHKEELLIDRSIGSHGHGSSFISGSEYYIGPEFALLLSSNGHEFRYRYSEERYQQLPADKDYLLLFRNYCIPKTLEQLPSFQSMDPNPFPRYFREEEIECLREKLWTAELNVEGDPLQVWHSRVNGYSYKRSSGRMDLYVQFGSHYCRSRTGIKFRGEEIEYNAGL
jgi:hypothetical protein